MDVLRLFVERGQSDPGEIEDERHMLPLTRYQGEIEGFQYLLNHVKSTYGLDLPEKVTQGMLKSLCRYNVDDRCLGYWVQLGGDLAGCANKGLTLFLKLLSADYPWGDPKPSMFCISSRGKLLVTAGFDVHEKGFWGMTALAYMINQFENDSVLSPWRFFMFLHRNAGPGPAERSIAYLVKEVSYFNARIEQWLGALEDIGVDVPKYISKERELFQGSLVLADEPEQYGAPIAGVVGEERTSVRGTSERPSSELHLVFDADGRSIYYEHYQDCIPDEGDEPKMSRQQPLEVTNLAESPTIRSSADIPRWKRYLVAICSISVLVSQRQQASVTEEPRSSTMVIRSSLSRVQTVDGSFVTALDNYVHVCHGRLMIKHGLELTLADLFDNLGIFGRARASATLTVIYVLVAFILGILSQGH